MLKICNSSTSYSLWSAQACFSSRRAKSSNRFIFPNNSSAVTGAVFDVGCGLRPCSTATRLTDPCLPGRVFLSSCFDGQSVHSTIVGIACKATVRSLVAVHMGTRSMTRDWGMVFSLRRTRPFRSVESSISVSVKRSMLRGARGFRLLPSL